MATAGDIINRALRTAGILASGETADANMANDALVTLNDMLAGLSNEGLMIYANVGDSLTLDGSALYSYGAGGGDVNSARPMEVLSICYRDSDGQDYPIDIITLSEYKSVTDKNLSGDIVEWVYINYTYPLAELYVYPVSSVGSLSICATKPLTTLAGLATEVSLPPGYDRMLRYGLAHELMIEYGLANPMITQQFVEAKADLKRTNFRADVLRVSVPFGAGARNRRIESDGL